jgi:G3E family GTPase
LVLVGYLGAGKTTLLKRMVQWLICNDWQPYIVLNDYQNARLDTTWIRQEFAELAIDPLAGSCICCSGLNELREALRQRPANRKKPITLIEANGTTDPFDLLAHLTVGIDQTLCHPIQITPIHAELWQQRGDYNELESRQLATASWATLTWADRVPETRHQTVRQQIQQHNPQVNLFAGDELEQQLATMVQTTAPAGTFPAPSSARSHSELAHWSSCDIELPETMSQAHLDRFLEALGTIANARVKGCVHVKDPDQGLIYFERFEDGRTQTRPFPGRSAFGHRCIVIAPAVSPELVTQKLLATA